jgi:hypothetical protein
MSLRRIGSRAVFVGIGMLASLALMAAPSGAAKGGNEANAKLCEPGGYPGVLLAQDGSAFKNAGKCTGYAAKGQQIAGVNVVATASGGAFNADCSGFGLKPGSQVTCGAKWEGAGETVLIPNQSLVEPNGTWSGNLVNACTLGRAHLIFLFVEGPTAKGVGFLKTFPPPSGCSTP